MRTVLVGSDFMYNKNGNLVPIEINTNVGWDYISKIENNIDCLDLTDLVNFINVNNFNKIEYIGGMVYFFEKLSESVDIECNHTIVHGSLTVPYIEDSETTLIIRSAYDTTAIVDDEYCANKINFLNLIKNESFGSEFAYRNSDGEIINTITTIIDNGIHPNFILKESAPYYNSSVYPKLYRIENLSELETIFSELTENLFIMPYYVNLDKLIYGHIPVVRSLNLLFPPNLESIQLGQYTKFSENKINESPTYDSTTFKYTGDRTCYLTSKLEINVSEPKLEDTDVVIMADGTEKMVIDLEIGDLIKTIDIPNPFNYSQANEAINYMIDYPTFISGVTYSTNKITDKRKIDRRTNIVTIIFDDESTWYDTGNSRYLVERNDEIRFILTSQLKPNDKLLLIDSSDSVNVNVTKKTVSTIETTVEFFNGWIIGVENAHLFLTKSEINNSSYVTIEHNSACGCDTGPFAYTCGCGGGACIKGQCIVSSYSFYGYYGYGMCYSC